MRIQKYIYFELLTNSLLFYNGSRDGELTCHVLDFHHSDGGWCAIPMRYTEVRFIRADIHAYIVTYTKCRKCNCFKDAQFSQETANRHPRGHTMHQLSRSIWSVVGKNQLWTTGSGLSRKERTRGIAEKRKNVNDSRAEARIKYRPLDVKRFSPRDSSHDGKKN